MTLISVTVCRLTLLLDLIKCQDMGLDVFPTEFMPIIEVSGLSLYNWFSFLANLQLHRPVLSSFTLNMNFPPFCSPGPRWASWNLGIFICIRCAGIHRNLGVHISKVKSVNLDQWTQEQVQVRGHTTDTVHITMRTCSTCQFVNFIFYFII